jgi:hypothetical protein
MVDTDDLVERLLAQDKKEHLRKLRDARRAATGDNMDAPPDVPFYEDEEEDDS